MVDEPGPLTEEELLERLQEEMRRITVSDYLAHLLVSLSSMAFQRLGLTPDTVADRDLPQSRMAIDAFEALVEVLSTGLAEQEASLYRSTLHQMRMAFVRASSDALTTGAGTVPETEPDDAEAADGVEPPSGADSPSADDKETEAGSAALEEE